MDLKGYPKRPTWSQREPKGSQSEPLNPQKHHLRNRVEKVGKKGGTVPGFWEPVFVKIYKIPIPQIIKETITKTHGN